MWCSLKAKRPTLSLSKMKSQGNKNKWKKTEMPWNFILFGHGTTSQILGAWLE